MQELEVLNLAVNNIQRVQNLQRCESLRCLDLSVNFIDRAGLLSLRRLAGSRVGGCWGYRWGWWKGAGCNIVVRLHHPRAGVCVQ